MKAERVRLSCMSKDVAMDGWGDVILAEDAARRMEEVEKQVSFRSRPRSRFFHEHEDPYIPVENDDSSTEK